MASSQALGEDLCKKLRMVGLQKDIVLPLVNLLAKQVLAEGPENVVRRLKVLKQGALNHLAGMPYDLPWIAHGPKGPKGPWKPVWQLLDRSSYKHKRRALNALMVYASLVLPKRASPTATQERKFLGSVEHSPEEVSARSAKLLKALETGMFSKGEERLLAALRSTDWKWRRFEPMPIEAYLAKVHGCDAKGAQKAEREIFRFLENNLEYHAFPSVQACLGDKWESYERFTAPWNGSSWDWRKATSRETPIGVVGSSQEPGYKFRAFASPNRVLQCALEGTKRNLLSALENLRWDNTHDQEKGVTEVQRWLREGKPLFSVDLSDATNNFPLSYQLRVLKRVGCPYEELKLMEVVSRGVYDVTWDKEKTAKWDVGQPLGAGPSFMAFALAHASVALDAEAAAGFPPERAGTSFMILGDDFITCDPAVHTEYRRRLDVLSCPISENKCLQSERAGEFAGKLILKEEVFHGFKFREVSDLSVLSIVRTLGPQAINRQLLTKEQYDFCRAVSEFPEPWGLGFNPKGRPFAERYKEYLDLREAFDAVKSDPITVRTESLKTAMSYGMKSRLWRYFRTAPVRSGDPSTAGQKGKPLKQAMMENLVPSERYVSPAKEVGDPRVNPLWNQRRGLEKAVEKVRKRNQQPEPEERDQPSLANPPQRTQEEIAELARAHLARLMPVDVSKVSAQDILSFGEEDRPKHRAFPERESNHVKGRVL